MEYFIEAVKSEVIVRSCCKMLSVVLKRKSFITFKLEIKKYKEK